MRDPGGRGALVWYRAVLISENNCWGLMLFIDTQKQASPDVYALKDARLYGVCVRKTCKKSVLLEFGRGEFQEEALLILLAWDSGTAKAFDNCSVGMATIWSKHW